MDLETPAQRLALFGIVVFAALATAAIVVWLISILDQGDRDSLWHWLDTHQDAIWGFLVASGPAALAWLFGRQTGLKRGTRKAAGSMVSVLRGAGKDAEANLLESFARREGWRL